MHNHPSDASAQPTDNAGSPSPDRSTADRPAADRRGRGLWWRVVLGTLGVALIALAAHLVWLEREVDRELTRIRDAGQPASLAELNTWYVEPGPGDANAANEYAKAFAAYTSDAALEQQLPPFTGKTWPDPVQPLPTALGEPADRYLSKNAEALEHLRAASVMEACRFPTDLDQGMAAELGHLRQLRHASKLLCMRAELAADQGESEAFVEAIDQMLALGDALAREPLLMSYLVRLRLYRNAVETLRRGMMQMELTEAQLQQLQRRLAGTVGRDGLVRALAGERVASLATFDDQDRRSRGVVKVMQNVTGVSTMDRLAYLRLMRMGIDAAEDRPRTVDREQFVASARALSGPDFLWQVLAPLIVRAIQVDQQWRASVQATTAMLAVRRYQLAHGRSPQRLHALVPDYLQDLPHDPYTGESLQYQQRGDKLHVYSRGPEGQGPGDPASTDNGIAFVLPRQRAAE